MGVGSIQVRSIHGKSPHPPPDPGRGQYRPRRVERRFRSYIPSSTAIDIRRRGERGRTGEVIASNVRQPPRSGVASYPSRSAGQAERSWKRHIAQGRRCLEPKAIFVPRVRHGRRRRFVRTCPRVARRRVQAVSVRRVAGRDRGTFKRAAAPRGSAGSDGGRGRRPGMARRRPVPQRV